MKIVGNKVGGNVEANQWRLGWRTPDAGVRYGKRKPGDANEQQNAQVAGHSLHRRHYRRFMLNGQLVTKVAHVPHCIGRCILN